MRTADPDIIGALAPLLIWLGLGLIGMSIGARRGQASVGFVLGLFLGPLGWLIAGVIPRSAKAQAEFEREVERRRAQLESKERAG